MKQEFRIVEDGRLRKLLGIRYEWLDMECDKNARVVLSMEVKAIEILLAFKKAKRYIPKNCSTLGKSGKVLKANEGEVEIHES